MEELTRLEERIMQCIWDYQGEVPFLDLIETVKEKLNKIIKEQCIRRIFVPARRERIYQSYQERKKSICAAIDR